MPQSLSSDTIAAIATDQLNQSVNIYIYIYVHTHNQICSFMILQGPSISFSLFSFAVSNWKRESARRCKVGMHVRPEYRSQVLEAGFNRYWLMNSCGG